MANEKKIPGVAFYGKVRYATLGHKKAIDTAKDIASKVGGRLHIGLSGTSEPLTASQKKQHAEAMFQHPVESGSDHTKNLFSYLSHLNQHHDEVHLVAGSDRAPEYRRTLQQWNGRADRSGKVSFNFKKWKVHEVEGKREDSGKHPTKMSRDELERSASATKVVGLATSGDYEGFKAYHPDMPEKHVKRVYDQIRKGSQIKEQLEIGELNHEKFGPMLDSFTQFAAKKLGIAAMPAMQLSKDDLGKSFGGYSPATKSIMIVTKNRHPMDIFRTVAHELVHHKQNEDGNLGKDIAKEGATGSPHENEANAEAGKIMRWFAKKNPELFKSGFVVEENNQHSSMTEDLRTWFKQKWVRFDTKGNIKGDCAREPGEGKPKCRPLASAVAMGKEARAKAARRKRREDPVADRSGKGNKPVNVKTESVQKAIDRINRDRMSEETLMEKNVPTNPQLWARAKSLAKSKFDVYPSAYANGWASKWYKSKGGGWKTAANESIEEACWDTHKQVGMKKKGNKMVPDCVPKNEAFEAFMEENKPSDREKEGTPGQSTPVNPLSEKKKKLKKEDTTPALGYEFGNNGIGPTFGVIRSPNGLGTGYSMPLSSMAESKQPKSISRLREAWEALGGRDMGTVAKQDKEELNERGADSKGLYRSTESGAGLTAKGAKHFGVKTAVTTPPSKLKPGSKAAKRRKSFCARMGGMKGPMKDEKGRPTRKAMSLRRWNCEE